MVLTVGVAALESVLPDPASTAGECLQLQRSTGRTNNDDHFRMRANVSSRRVSNNPGFPFWRLAHTSYARHLLICNRNFARQTPALDHAARCATPGWSQPHLDRNFHFACPASGEYTSECPSRHSS